MTQYGFFFDQSRCSGCNACAVACKSWHKLPPGPLKYLKVYEYEKGSFPDVRMHFQWVPCYHCQDPACVGICPSEAIYKEKKYGAVLIDSEKCTGCRMCYEACPYGAPVFESDELTATAAKCTMCFDRLGQELKPICTLACPDRALDFGPLDALMERYGGTADLEDLPGSRTTRPAVLFKPHLAKRRLVPYDTRRIIELMMERDKLPALFVSSDDVMEIPPGTVGRDCLVIKHETADELLRYTRNDEG